MNNDMEKFLFKKRPVLESLDDKALLHVRSMYGLVSSLIVNSEFPIEGSKEKLESIQSEMDKVDVEILSRGIGSGGDDN